MPLNSKKQGQLRGYFLQFYKCCPLNWPLFFHLGKIVDRYLIKLRIVFEITLLSIILRIISFIHYGKTSDLHEQDIRSLAIEIATLTKRQQRGKGLRMA